MMLLMLVSTVRDRSAIQYVMQEKELSIERIRAMWAVQLGLGYFAIRVNDWTVPGLAVTFMPPCARHQRAGHRGIAGWRRFMQHLDVLQFEARTDQ